MEGVTSGCRTHRRAPRASRLPLALPVIALVYVSAFGGRLWAALRPAVATFLGATVIGSVYAEVAYRRAPATPTRGRGIFLWRSHSSATEYAPTPSCRGGDPAEAVIAAARDTSDPTTCSAQKARAVRLLGLDLSSIPRRRRAAAHRRHAPSRASATCGGSSHAARFTEDESERGDLVIWDRGEHIGIYLGDGKAISALIEP